MKINEQILLHMALRGISRNQVADKAGISRTGLAYILNGTKSPTFDTITKICAALDISIQTLFSDPHPSKDLDATDEESTILHNYRQTSLAGRTLIQACTLALKQVYPANSAMELGEEFLKDPIPTISATPQQNFLPIIRNAQRLPWILVSEINDFILSQDLRVQPGDFCLPCAQYDIFLDYASPGDLAVIRCHTAASQIFLDQSLASPKASLQNKYVLIADQHNALFFAQVLRSPLGKQVLMDPGSQQAFDPKAYQIIGILIALIKNTPSGT